jgi:[ribosomal protein S5]-alanine N-acetyltransferase
MLTTQRLFLMPLTPKLLDAAVAQDWDKLSDLLGGVYFARNWNQFPDSFAFLQQRLRAHPEEQAWWGYIILNGLDARVAGTCGFKGMPTPEGTVEIGYAIADRYRNQGLATEAATALVEHAFNNEAVQAVLAHTLPEENASCAVLRHLGFEWEGPAEEDGQMVWRWRKSKNVFA